MKKIMIFTTVKPLLILITFFFFLIPLFRTTGKAEAVDVSTECSISPSVAMSNNTNPIFTITDEGKGLVPANSYLISINGKRIRGYFPGGDNAGDFLFTFSPDRQIILDLEGKNNFGYTNGVKWAWPEELIDKESGGLKSNVYNLELFEKNNKLSSCKLTFEVKSTKSAASCNIEIIPLTNASTPEEKRTLQIAVGGLADQEPSNKRVVLQFQPGKNSPNIKFDCFKLPSDTPINLGELSMGDYYLTIYDSCLSWYSRNIAGNEEQPICSASLSVSNDGVKILAQLKNPSNSPVPPCSEQGEGAEKKITCPTAIGDVDVSSPQAFIAKLFSIILSVAGIGAIGLFIYAGYLFMTSEGDKQKVQGARETITSAISGLLFIIFSIVILQIIGVNILHLPGFK